MVECECVLRRGRALLDHFMTSDTGDLSIDLILNWIVS
jgi:hypothetical protein